jgi:hypothetical protein
MTMIVHLNQHIVLVHLAIANKAAHGRDGLFGGVILRRRAVVATLLAHFVHLQPRSVCFGRHTTCGRCKLWYTMAAGHRAHLVHCGHIIFVME